MAEQPETIIVEVPSRIVTVDVEIPARVATVEVQIPGNRGLRGTRITASTTPPENPMEGDFWLDLSEGP